MGLLSKRTRELFLHSNTQQEVDVIHHGICTQPFGKKPEKLSVLDFLADPNTGFSCVQHHQNICDALLKDKHTQWSEFGFRAGPDVTIMTARHEFVQYLAPMDISLLENPNANPKEISRLTWYARTPSTHLAFKYWFLVKNLSYEGVHATTAPVLEALKTYWQTKSIFGKTLRAQSDFQYELAAETGLEPNRLNTTLWVLGRAQFKHSKSIDV